MARTNRPGVAESGIRQASTKILHRGKDDRAPLLEQRLDPAAGTLLSNRLYDTAVNV